MTTTPEPDFNPYAAPASEPGDAREADFYGIVSTRLRFRELWRMPPNPATFAILAVPRLLHIPTPFAFQTGVPRLKRLIPVELDEVPGHVRAKWRPIFEACAEH